MNSKVKELTEKIYNEGIEKAKKEAELIISNAEKKAEERIKDAELKAQKKLEQAEKNAKEIQKNTESELRLASQKFISSLKQTVNHLITTAQTEAPVKEAFNDKEFIQKMILTLLKNWKSDDPESSNIELLVPENDKHELNQFFEKRAKENLNSGLDIKFDVGIESGFKIKPKDGNYYISFTDKDFENYFKTYLKNKTSRLLFEE